MNIYFNIYVFVSFFYADNQKSYQSTILSKFATPLGCQFWLGPALQVGALVLWDKGDRPQFISELNMYDFSIRCGIRQHKHLPKGQSRAGRHSP